MKEYHAVFERRDGFRKEEAVTFQCDPPPPKYYITEYETLTPHMIATDCIFDPLPLTLRVKKKCFVQRARFSALGKNLVYFTEE